MTTKPNSMSERVRTIAVEAGFDSVGIAAPDAIGAAAQRLRQFLDKGRHGTMAWMETRAEQRENPSVLWPEVRSVVMVGQNYGPDIDPLAVLDDRSVGAISVYAQGRDYHDVVKKKLKAAARRIVSEFNCDVKVFVDTAPVLEKPLAEAAGIGWQGKHTNLVSREFGSWLFLGAIFTTLELQPDAQEPDHCGSCRQCLEICPTNAFPAPYQLDARRCISYLTIELKTQIPREFRTSIGNRIYGCDDCLAVCPWNKFAARASETKLHARDAFVAPPLEKLAALDDESFRQYFAGSPLKRTGRDRFIRNVMIAIGNSDDPEMHTIARDALRDHSPLVRGAAVWALSRLVSPGIFAELREAHEAMEPDCDVRAEWQFGGHSP